MWESIVDDINKHEIPVDVLDSIRVKLIDGSYIDVNIRQLADHGNTITEIKELLNEKMKMLGDMISDVDFFVCLRAVSNIVQPLTDNVLKDIT